MDKTLKLNLPARLEKIAGFIPCAGNVIADIGTDHAYLPVFLTQNGKASFSYACDINKGPLDNAEKTINQFGCAERIKTVLTNGLKNIPLETLNYIIIAGMGGKLIAKILEARRNELVGKTLLLQPMTNIEELRYYLNSSNFQIADEKIAVENNKIYIIMKVIYQKGFTESYSSFDYIIGKRIIENNTENKDRYLKKLHKKYTVIRDGLKNSSNADSEKLKFAEDMLLSLERLLCAAK